ncbi:WD40-repeat-containing domain protein [Mycena filopes]|nr:WD40-repeat-containing domain protein [Mycena filopes]
MPVPQPPLFEQKKVIHAHSDNINTLSFSDNGELLVSGGDDGCINIYNTNSWQLVKSYRMVSPVRVALWNPRSNSIITAGLKNGLINTIQTKNNVKWEHEVTGTVHCMSFQKPGKLLAIGFNNQVLIVKQTSTCVYSFF